MCQASPVRFMMYTNYAHFIVTGWAAFQLQYKLSTGTDSSTVTTRARKDGVSA